MDVTERLVELSQGVYVERDVLNIIEKIYAYDSNLRVKYLDGPGRFDQAPYAIFEMCPDGIERLVFSVWELDERVLERLFNSDTLKSDVLGNLDRNNNLIRNDRQRRFEEAKEESKDILLHMLKSPKGRYSFPTPTGNIVTVDDQPGRVAKIETGRDKAES